MATTAVLWQMTYRLQDWFIHLLILSTVYEHDNRKLLYNNQTSSRWKKVNKLRHFMPRSNSDISLPISPRSSGTWRKVIRTVRNIIQTVSNRIERQEVGSVPVCIAPINTNVVKRGRGAKPSENRSQTGLTKVCITRSGRT